MYTQTCRQNLKKQGEAPLSPDKDLEKYENSLT